MKKSRKIMMVLCVVALLVSVLAIPASAATNANITRFLGKVLSGMPRQRPCGEKLITPQPIFV